MSQRFSDTFELELSKINANPKTFQGRQTEFSEDTVNAIVAKGYYDKSAEPIVVWFNQDDSEGTGKYYVISGHSRFEAAKRLYAKGQKDLATIPVKEFKGTRQEAQEYAVLESNRGGTEEGLLSDIKAFKLAKNLGKNKDWLRGNFRPESKFEKLDKLSYLADNGRFIETLTGKASASFPYIERNAVWVGTLRKALPALTDAHENEIFAWLYQGDRKALAMSKDKFMQEIDKRVNRIDFDATKPLNFANSVSANPYTDPLNDEIREIEREIERLNRERDKQLENIKKAQAGGLMPLVSKFRTRIGEIDTLILRKMVEQDGLRAKIGKLERETIVDLFSDPAPAPSPEKPITTPAPMQTVDNTAKIAKLKAALAIPGLSADEKQWYTDTIAKFEAEMQPVVNKPTQAPVENSQEAPLTCPPIDAKGERRIDDEGLKLLKKCIDSEPQTKAIHAPNGNYTPQRLKLHDKIIGDFKQNKACVVRTQPVAVLTGGPPGSGKTTFLKKFAPWLVSGKVYHIDADEVRSKLPEYKGWNANNTHLETKDIVTRLIDEIGEPCEYDLIYDGTMNKAANYMPLIEQLKKLGYKVFVIYIQVPKSVSMERAMGRYQRSGRYVPVEVIDEVYEKGLDAYEQVIKNVDGYIRVNGETQKIIERGGMEFPKDRPYNFEGKNEDCDCNKKENKLIQPTKITLKIAGKGSVKKEFTGNADLYQQANAYFRKELNDPRWSDMEYDIDFEDGEQLKGVIDCEPRSFYDGNDNPLSWHLNTFYGNFAKAEPKAHILKEDIDWAKKLVNEYNLGPKEKTNKAPEYPSPKTFKPTPAQTKAAAKRLVKESTPKPASKRLSAKEQLEKQQAELRAYQTQINEAKKGGLTKSEVIKIARKINSTRRLSSQLIDGAKDHKYVLEPTEANLRRWAKEPGKYDLQSVDTASDEPKVTKEFKKGYNPRKRTWWDELWDGDN